MSWARCLSPLTLTVIFIGLNTAGPASAGDGSSGYATSSSDSSKSIWVSGYDDGWQYDPYYIFPLTRHMNDSGLPFWAQVPLYPIGFAIDLVQWPVGLLAGLGGQ
jgi:hypothetical protein